MQLYGTGFSTPDWLDFRDPGLIIIAAVFLLGLIYTLLEGRLPAGEDASETFLFTVLVYGGGLLIFYGGFRTYKKLQIIRGTPTSKIRSMAMGPVELNGQTEPNSVTLKSPFSGEKCLFYKYKVEEYRSDDDGGHWALIDQGREGTRFFLKDETGTVMVDPEGADLEIPVDNQFEASGFDSAPEPVKEFIERNEGVDRGEGLLGIFDNRRRYTEWYVTPGEQLYLFGYASKERDERGERILVQDHRSLPMFMISDKSEKELRNEKSWKYKLMILGGIIAAPAGLAMMFFMTGIL